MIKPRIMVCLLLYEILSYVEKKWKKIEAFSQGLKILELYLRQGIRRFFQNQNHEKDIPSMFGIRSPQLE